MSESRAPNALAVIPARGGSAGVPRKNLVPIAGVPLVVRAIRAARAAETVAVVVVSTDDDEIAALAAAEHVAVVRRPADLATSTASSESAVRHTISELAAAGTSIPEVTLLVQCTSPFIAAADLDLVVRTLDDEHADSCMTVSPTH